MVGRRKTDITESFRTEMQPARSGTQGDDKPDKNHLRSTDIHDARRPTCPDNTARLTFVPPNYGLRKTDIHTVVDPPWQLKEEKWHGLRKTDMGRPDPEAHKAEGMGEPWEVCRLPWLASSALPHLKACPAGTWNQLTEEPLPRSNRYPQHRPKRPSTRPIGAKVPGNPAQQTKRCCTSLMHSPEPSMLSVLCPLSPLALPGT